MSNPKSHFIGKYKDLNIEIVTWDGVTAEVDLSCGCLFTHEVNHAEMKGGLADLNHALNGKVQQIREQKLFEAERFETILFNQPQSTIQSSQVLLIGLGEPEEWSAKYTAKAVQIAFRTGNQLSAKSVAFAPSLLDTGLSPTEKFNHSMLQALLEVYDAHLELEKLGLVKTATVKHWVFDAGDHQFDEKAQGYIDEFQNIISSK